MGAPLRSACSLRSAPLTHLVLLIVGFNPLITPQFIKEALDPLNTPQFIEVALDPLNTPQFIKDPLNTPQFIKVEEIDTIITFML